MRTEGLKGCPQIPYCSSAPAARSLKGAARGRLRFSAPRSLNKLRHTAVGKVLDNSSVEKVETRVADGADPDDLANQYEFVLLYGLSVPNDLEQIMREAYRGVHLRGLDPLRTTAR